MSHLLKCYFMCWAIKLFIFLLLIFLFQPTKKHLDLLINRGWKQAVVVNTKIFLSEFLLWFKTFFKTLLTTVVMFSWTRRASVSSCLRSDTTASTGQVYSCCVEDQSDRFAVTKNKRAVQRCGKLSQRTKLFSLWAEGRNRAVLGQHGQTWALVQRRLLRFVFEFRRSEQTSSSNQTANGGLAVSPRLPLSSTLILATGSPRKWLLSSSPLPIPSFLISPLPLLLLISCSFVGLGLIRRAPVDSHLPPPPPHFLQSKC